MDLLVVGHTNIDHFFHVERLPAPDRTVPLKDRKTRLGGTAANIARVAARLGIRASLASLVGPDFPLHFREMLLREGVDLTSFATIPGVRSPACFIVESSLGEQVTLIDQGPMEEDSGASVPTELLGRVAWVHLATGNPKYQLRVLGAARRRGLRVAADPAQEIHYRWEPTLLRRLLRSSELFFANKEELARALRLLRIRNVRGLLKVVPLIVETRGPEGAVAWTRAGPIRVPAVRPRKLRQVSGAGDGFRGGFYAGWFRGLPLRDCLAYGSWAAARWLESGDPTEIPVRHPPARPAHDLGSFARREV